MVKNLMLWLPKVLGTGHGSSGGSNGGWKFNVSGDAVFWAVVLGAILVGAYLLFRRFVE